MFRSPTKRRSRHSARNACRRRLLGGDASFRRTNLSFEALEPRRLLAVDSPVPLWDNLSDDSAETSLPGSITQVEQVDYFFQTFTESGRLTLMANASEGASTDTMLRLYRSSEPADGDIDLSTVDVDDWQLLTENDDLEYGTPNAQIVQHLIAGTYLVAVSASPAAPDGDGDYELTAVFQAAIEPFVNADIRGAPHAIASGDFNNDGHLDVATANRDNDTVTVLLGLGDGTFREVRESGAAQLQEFRVGQGPESMVAVDINDDNVVDLIVANKLSSDLSVLLGNGDGTFRENDDARWSVGLGSGPQDLVVDDFNGDGIFDVATANRFDDTISILIGKGNGAFETPQTIAVEDSPRGIIAAHFNDDGRVDLAVANRRSDSVSILINVGGGTFQQFAGPFPVSSGPWDLVAKDFDGDSDLDLAVVSDKSSDVTLLFNETDDAGVVYFAAQGQKLTAGQDSEAIAVADFNGDEYYDLAVLNEDSADVSVFLGRPDGGFQTGKRFVVGDEPQSLVIKDFNDDGRFDIAVASRGQSTVTVLLGQGNGSFLSDPRNPVGEDPESIIIADFDGDGRMDVATANRISDTVSVLLGTGNGAFAPAMHFDVGEGPWDLKEEDFNGDERLDLATVNRYSDDVSILLGLGDGTFRDALTFDLRDQSRGECPSCIVGPISLVVGEFDENTGLDLAIGNEFVGDMLLVGNGDGTFERVEEYDGQIVSAVDVPEMTSGRFAPFGIVSADFNRDGYEDFVTANDFAGEVSIRLGRSDGTFASELRFRAAASDPTKPVVADFNNDQIPDIALAHESEDVVSILLGRGDGTFYQNDCDPTEKGDVCKLGKNLDGAMNPNEMIAIDFDGDQTQDLAIVNSVSGSVSILLGNGDGGFARQIDITEGINGSPQSITSGDFDGDNKPDLVIAYRDRDFVGLLLSSEEQSGPWIFQNTDEYLDGGGEEIFAADVDGDNYTDLVILDQKSWKMTILRGGEDASFEKQETIDGDLTFPMSFVIGNFDGNEYLDLAVASKTEDNVTIFLQNEDGEFIFGGTYLAGDGAWDIVTTDVDRDGNIDLLVSNRHGRSVSLLRGYGDGTFLDGTVANGGVLGVGAAELAIASADLNGDGQLESVVATVTDSVEVSSQNAIAVVPDRLGAGPLLEDLNGDGIVDAIITVDRDGSVFLRTGSVEEGFDGYHKLLFASDNPENAARDVALVHSPDGIQLAVLKRTGSQITLYSLDRFDFGSLADGELLEVITSDDHAHVWSRIVAMDTDGDGTDDQLIALATGDAKATIFARDENGQFTAGGHNDVATGQAPSDLLLVDTNGDSVDDTLLVTNWTSGDVSVLIPEGNQFDEQSRVRASDGLFGINNLEWTVESREQTSSITTGQFNDDNGDGRVDQNDHLDLAVTSIGTNSFSILLGKGDGTTFVRVPGVNTTGERPTVIRAGQLVGDEDLDLAVLNESDGTISIYRGVGDGTFVLSVEAISAGNVPVGLEIVGDINGDQIADMIVSNQFGDLLTIVSRIQADNVGTVAFYPETRYEVESFPYQDTAPLAATSEFVVFGNGDLDRLSVELSDQSRLFDRIRGQLKGSDNAALLSPTDFEFGNLTSRIGTSDAVVDLLVANGGSGELLVYAGAKTEIDHSGGTAIINDFIPLDSFRFDGELIDIASGDINGDGWLDVVVATRNPHQVHVLFNTRMENESVLRKATTVSIVGQPISVGLVDQNGDGRVDLLVTSNTDSGGIVTLYLAEDAGIFVSSDAKTLSFGTNISQGPVVDDRVGFVVLVDGRMASFRLDDFDSPNGAPVVVEVDGLGKQVRWLAAALIGTDANGNAELLATGFEQGAEGETALLVHLTAESGEPFVIEQHLGDGNLVNPSRLAVVDLGGGTFRAYVSQSGSRDLFVVDDLNRVIAEDSDQILSLDAMISIYRSELPESSSKMNVIDAIAQFDFSDIISIDVRILLESASSAIKGLIQQVVQYIQDIGVFAPMTRTFHAVLKTVSDAFPGDLSGENVASFLGYIYDVLEPLYPGAILFEIVWAELADPDANSIPSESNSSQVAKNDPVINNSNDQGEHFDLDEDLVDSVNLKGAAQSWSEAIDSVMQGVAASSIRVAITVGPLIKLFEELKNEKPVTVTSPQNPAGPPDERDSYWMYGTSTVTTALVATGSAAMLWHGIHRHRRKIKQKTTIIAPNG